MYSPIQFDFGLNMVKNYFVFEKIIEFVIFQDIGIKISKCTYIFR